MNVSSKKQKKPILFDGVVLKDENVSVNYGGVARKRSPLTDAVPMCESSRITSVF